MARLSAVVVLILVTLASGAYARVGWVHKSKLRLCSGAGQCGGGGQANSATSSPAATPSPASCTFGSATFPCDF